MPKDKAPATKTARKKAVKKVAPKKTVGRPKSKPEKVVKKATKKATKKTAKKATKKAVKKVEAPAVVSIELVAAVETAIASLPQAPMPKRRGRPPSNKVTIAELAARAEAAPTATVNARGKRVVNYLNNADMLRAVLDSKKAGRMNDTLATMLMMLVDRYATKGSFVNYTYNDEMRGFALMQMMRTWASFNENKSTNPFAYYTQCVKNNFIQYLKVEKKNQRIRDALMMDAGYMPSYAMQNEYRQHIHDEYGETDSDNVDQSYKKDSYVSKRSSESFDRVFDTQEAHEIDALTLDPDLPAIEEADEIAHRYGIDDDKLFDEFILDIPEDDLL